MLVHQLICQGKGEEPALFDKQQTVTYGQLQQQVERYRSYFYQQGIRPGENVGIVSKNSVEFVYSYLAIVSLGAVVVPLNFQLVSREISYIVQDARMRHIVTMQPLKLDSARFGYTQKVHQLIISKFSAEIDKICFSPAPVAREFAGDTVAVIIYTSGTTGYPKGAMLTHDNLISDARAFSEAVLIKAEDNVLCILPMFHCFAWTCAVLTPLLKGAAITIADNFSIRENISLIRNSGLTVVFGIPALYKLFATWGTPEDFAKVRLFISGGSSLPQEILRQFQAKTGKAIVEGYGLSEASPVVTVNPVDKTKTGSVGKALPGIRVCIIDVDNAQVLPEGEIGELLVQGPVVMKGYYNLPAESAQTVRQGWLHTGDLAYRDEAGYIFIVDRLKDMIIAGGENIYPREIEELIYTYPGVLEAAVIGVPDKLRGDYARACVVPEEGQTLDTKKLRNYLKENLAAYKIPKEIVICNSLPKNATGKILKRVLREQA
ncbi:MAG: long-chain-fatty-acid--CoA ligase [Veillonellales bacterium]